MDVKPFKVVVDGNPAIAIRYDKKKPRAMRVREMKKRGRKGC